MRMREGGWSWEWKEQDWEISEVFSLWLWFMMGTFSSSTITLVHAPHAYPIFSTMGPDRSSAMSRYQFWIDDWLKDSPLKHCGDGRKWHCRPSWISMKGEGVGGSGDTDSTYINEGCIHVVCVLLTPLNWNDHSVELICRKDSSLWLSNITCLLLSLFPSFLPTPGPRQIKSQLGNNVPISSPGGRIPLAFMLLFPEATEELRATSNDCLWAD